MVVLGIDPGFEQSAVVAFDGAIVLNHGIHANEHVLSHLSLYVTLHTVLVIERIASFGMPVGEEVFETVYWSGRFAQAWNGRVERLKRHEIKMHICHQTKATDAHIRQSLMDRFGPGKDKAIGKKKTPGPLYGFHGDEWAALAVAVTWHDLNDSRHG